MQENTSVRVRSVSLNFLLPLGCGYYATFFQYLITSPFFCQTPASFSAQSGSFPRLQLGFITEGDFCLRCLFQGLTENREHVTVLQEEKGWFHN